MRYDETLANWIWLSDLDDFDKAVVIGRPEVPFLQSIASQFREVVAVEPDCDRRREIEEAFPDRTVSAVQPEAGALPIHDHSVNAVVLHIPPEVRTGSGARARIVSMVKEADRVLVGTGRLFMTWQNPSWHRRLLRFVGWSVDSSGVAAEGIPGWRANPASIIQRSQFRVHHHYYVSPSLSNPRYVVPVDRNSMLAVIHGASRRWMVRLGGHSLVFPVSLVKAAR